MSYFSVPFYLVTLNRVLPYDIYVNSSAIETKEHFVKIFKAGGTLNQVDIDVFKAKYRQIYIPEGQRNFYLTSLVGSTAIDDTKKSEIIKDSAITHLNKLFDAKADFNTEMLVNTIKSCKDTVSSMVEVLKDYSINDLQHLISKLSFHDFYTFDHSVNVGMYSIGLLKAVNPEATNDELTVAGLGGLLHDLGKMKISTELINKPGKLTPEEFDMIKKHPEFGLDLLGSTAAECKGINLHAISRVVFEHHENYNGTGYPQKLKGDDIYLLARITAIADFFDAITTQRSYHEVLKTEEAIPVMAKTKGIKIDPKLFEIFTQSLQQFTLTGKMNVELPSDFDPCQPQHVLPFAAVTKKVEAKDYGKIKLVTEIIGKKDKKSA